MKSISKKINVIHFQRKARPGFNFSIESIFEDLRCHLKSQISFSVKTCSFFNTGYFSKMYNIIEAAFAQRKNAIAHITGEIHFINFFMRKKNVVLTIHDCRFMKRKEGIAKILMQYVYLKWPVRKSAYIVAVSEYTKKDIIKYTGCNPEKIKVVPVSVNKKFLPSPKMFNQDCPVILQVGTGPNKNLLRLIEAVKEIRCKLVIVGNLNGTVYERLHLYKTSYQVKSGLSIEELYAEYINCDIVAFISTFEGFGMPIIEANCVEKPVITSNISSMPEVAGNAACLVNPYDIQDIRKHILELIQDQEYREQLIANGRENRKRFSASVVADAYYEIYKKMAKQL